MQGWTLSYFEAWSCRTSECNFHLSELKIHLPTFFVRYSLTGFSVPTTAFSVKEGSNFTCPINGNFSCLTGTFSYPG